MHVSFGPADDCREVRIATGGVVLAGELAVPAGAAGAVALVRDGGRLGPRERHLAQVLRNLGLATLAVELLSPREEEVDRFTGHLRGDVVLLAQRLAGVAGWLKEDLATATLPLGLFGDGAGAAPALVAAADRPDLFMAVATCAGRPDLAGEALGRVVAPTLLVVGGHDPVLLDVNEQAYARLPGARRLTLVPGAASHFEEPAALEEVARVAAEWLLATLAPRRKTA